MHKSRILVVDDDNDLASLISDFLKIKGYEIVGKGNNGKEAVELYKKFHPDISLIDLYMPEYGGVYALLEILQIHPHAQIIITTSDNSRELRQKLFEKGAKNVLNKPFEIQMLMDAITSIESPIIQRDSNLGAM